MADVPPRDRPCWPPGGAAAAAGAAALLLVLFLTSGCAARAAAPRHPSAAGVSALSGTLAHLVWPLRFDGRRNVSSGYGYRTRAGGGGRHHTGLDLQARRGDPVYSAGDGVVAAGGESGAYGRFVSVDHGQELSSFYAHLETRQVRTGERIRRGQVIGFVGSTGNATGPHLHFELRWRGRWVDPLSVLPELE